MVSIKKTLKIRTAELLLAFLILFSGGMLAFSSGSFIMNFDRIGFSVVSTVQEGAFNVFGYVKKFFS